MIAQENRYADEMGTEEESQESESPRKGFEVNFTVGRIEDGTAILLSKDHNIVEIPLCLLPPEIGPGNILKFNVSRNKNEEKKRVKKNLATQKQILEDPNFFDD